MPAADAPPTRPPFSAVCPHSQTHLPFPASSSDLLLLLLGVLQTPPCFPPRPHPASPLFCIPGNRPSRVPSLSLVQMALCVTGEWWGRACRMGQSLALRRSGSAQVAVSPPRAQLAERNTHGAVTPLGPSGRCVLTPAPPPGKLGPWAGCCWPAWTWGSLPALGSLASHLFPRLCSQFLAFNSIR